MKLIILSAKIFNSLFLHCSLSLPAQQKIYIIVSYLFTIIITIIIIIIIIIIIQFSALLPIFYNPSVGLYPRPKVWEGSDYIYSFFMFFAVSFGWYFSVIFIVISKEDRQFH